MTNGTFRAIIRGSKVELAPDVLAEPITRPVMLRNVWYFVTEAGDIFSAPSFLGPLTDTGLSVGSGALLAAEAPERVLLADRSNALWSFTGSAVVRMNPPPPGRVTSLGDGPNGRPLVGICERLYSVRPDGSFQPVPPPSKRKTAADEDAFDPVEYGGLTTKVEAALNAWPWASARALRALQTTVVLHDGSLAQKARVLPPGHQDCHLLQAGREPLVYCPPSKAPGFEDGDEEDELPGAVFRLSTTGEAVPWLEVPSHADPVAGPGPALLAHDYLSDVWLHAGEREVLVDVTRDWGCEDGDEERQILGLSGARILITRRCGQAISFALADLTRKKSFGGLENQPLTDLLPQGAQIEDAGLSADQDALWILFRTPANPSKPSNQLALALGSLDQPLTVALMPENARSVAFVDGRRGLASGAHLAQVWSTLDGGAHWSKLTFPSIHGDAAAVSIRERLVCNLVACGTSQFAWADPRALTEVGYQPGVFVAPRHVPADRRYGAPPPRWDRRFREPEQPDVCAKRPPRR
jgi:hypothetical protein